MTSSPPDPDRHHHPLRWVALAAVAVVVLAVGGVALLFLTREDPDAKDVDEAVEEFRATTSTSGSTPPAEVTRPAAGVYRAEGEGREELSFPPLHQDDGASLPLTVEHLDAGCWQWTIDFNEAHWQSWEHCPDDGRVVEHGGTTFQQWDVGATTLDSTAEFVCDPPNVAIDPNAEPGATWDDSCSGTNTAIEGSTVTAGTTTYVGPEELEIGGEPVPVQHYRQDLAITGSQVGTNVVDYWVAASGLVVRMERAVAVATDSPVGSITYDETGWWQLTALDPVD